MVKIYNCIVGPKSLFDFLPSDDLASGFNQHSQDLKWLLPEKDPVTVCDSRLQELARMEVNLELSEPDATHRTIFHTTFEPWLKGAIGLNSSQNNSNVQMCVRAACSRFDF
jgi:hypothetical protein